MTGTQRRYLRARAHRLDPVVSIGRCGITGGVVEQVDGALADHELIKVKVGRECPTERRCAAALLTERTRSELAGMIGGVLVLYRPHPDVPRIRLPEHHGTAERGSPR